MKKQICINGSYIESVIELKELLKSNRVYSEDFREQMLDVYDNGRLQEWLDDHDCHIDIENISKHSDIECFKSLYQAIVGESCMANLNCNFFEYAELKVMSDDGVFVEPFGQTVFLNLPSGKLLFRFDSIGKGRETFKLSLKDGGGNEVGAKEILLGFDSKEEVPFEVSKPDVYALYEGEDNFLCEVSCGLNKEIESSDKKHRLKLFGFFDEKGDLRYMTELISDKKQVKELVETNRDFDDNTIRKEYVRWLMEKMEDQYETFMFEIPNEKQIECVFKNVSFSKEYQEGRFKMACEDSRIVQGQNTSQDFDFKPARDKDAVNAVCFLVTDYYVRCEEKRIRGTSGSTLKLYRLPNDKKEEYLTEIVTGGITDYTTRKRSEVSKKELANYSEKYSGWQFEFLSEEYYELYKNILPFKKQWEGYNVFPETWDVGQNHAIVFLVREKTSNEK